MAGNVHSAKYETECRAIGTLNTEKLENVVELLTGLSTRDAEELRLHTVVLKAETGPPRELILLRRFPGSNEADDKEKQSWTAVTETVLFRGGIKDLPVGVRSVSTAECHGHNVPDFWCKMGLKQAYESVRQGHRFVVEISNEQVQVDVYRLFSVSEQRNLDSIKAISDALHIIEVRCSTGTRGHQPGVEAIGQLGQFLQSHVHLQKA